VVQIHRRDKTFSNLASVTSINGELAQTVSMDMVYNGEKTMYYIYVHVVAEGYK
jgi:hypothetical protein